VHDAAEYACQGNNDEASYYYNKAPQFNSNFADASYYDRGIAYGAQGDFD
jgi:hypothetical protein